MFYQHKVSRLISETKSVSERNSMVTISLVVLDILDGMAYMGGGYYVPIASKWIEDTDTRPCHGRTANQKKAIPNLFFSLNWL